LISNLRVTESFWMNGVRSTSWKRHSRSVWWAAGLVGGPEVLPGDFAVGVDRGAVEEAVLDVEPAAVLQAHGREALGVDGGLLRKAARRSGRVGAGEVEAGDAGAEERGGRVAALALRGARSKPNGCQPSSSGGFSKPLQNSGVTGPMYSW
jgi:hypothetical protein